MARENLKPPTIFCHDNLPVLRGINSDSIDLIYLDPPFNKGRDFHAPIGTKAQGATFQDIWSDKSVKDEWHNEINDRYPDLYKYLDAVGAIGSKSAKYYLVYMAVRLIEMHRILKDTGSIWLHCDPTASHYLKLLLDTIFGHQAFRNELIWHYKSSAMTGAKKIFPRKHDIIFFYTKTKTSNYTFNQSREGSELSDDMLKGWGKYLEPDGKTILWGSIKHEKGQERKHYARLKKELGRAPIDSDVAWTAMPPLTRSVWVDIQQVRGGKVESVGYPTQKPLALLERIITAGSKEGDLVLDPFCGCATTCVAAHRLGRQWIGIDVSPKARDLVKERIDANASQGMIEYPLKKLNYLESPPKRTDVKYKTRPTQEDKKYLYGNQNGKCKGCSTKFEIQHLEIDHIIPISQSGGNERENLQLLCGSCNRIKGDRPMEYLKMRLKQLAE